MIYIAIILFAIFLDQYSKYLVIAHIKPIDTLPLIPDVFHLTYVENTGVAAFSLMTNKQIFFNPDDPGFYRCLNLFFN